MHFVSNGQSAWKTTRATKIRPSDSRTLGEASRVATRGFFADIKLLQTFLENNLEDHYQVRLKQDFTAPSQAIQPAECDHVLYRFW